MQQQTLDADRKLQPSESQPEISQNIGVTMEDLWKRQRSMNWEQTLSKSRRGSLHGRAEAIARLVFWHWSQPIFYIAALTVYWPELGNYQQAFGAVVALREVLYLLATIVLSVLQPSYLLVDVMASWREHYGLPNVLQYVLAPEKIVFRWVAHSPSVYLTCWYNVMILCLYRGTILTDLCAVAALFTAIHSGARPAALMVGYTITAISGLSTICLMISEKWRCAPYVRADYAA